MALSGHCFGVYMSGGGGVSFSLFMECIGAVQGGLYEESLCGWFFVDIHDRVIGRIGSSNRLIGVFCL